MVAAVVVASFFPPPEAFPLPASVKKRVSFVFKGFRFRVRVRISELGGYILVLVGRMPPIFARSETATDSMAFCVSALASAAAGLGRW